MKHILSLDGGGIRGLIQALVLDHLEQCTGRPVSQCFDLIAGTSTGGILALALCRPGPGGAPQYAAADLVRLYEEEGPTIFPRSGWRKFSSADAWLEEKYTHKGLESVLEKYLGNEPLGSALTRVMITSYDIQSREPLFLKSWREEWSLVEMRHAARATSAAPTYFEPALVPVSGSVKALIDGGVFINNPAMSAYVESRLLHQGEEVCVLSIGTGELTEPISYEDARDWGKAGWAVPLLDCMFDGASDAVNYQMQHLLGDSYVRLQPALFGASDAMDDVSQENLKNLRAIGEKLLRTCKKPLDRLCAMLKGSG